MSKSNDRRNPNPSPHLEEYQYGDYSYSYQFEDEAQNTAAQPAVSPQPAPKPKARKSGHLFLRIFVFLTILTVGLVVILQTVFRVEAVCVIGHQQRSARDVINVSGLTYGQSIFSIKTEEVARRLEKDHHFIFKGLQVKYPNLVYLQVEERQPVALMRHIGVYYVLDKDGMVMEEDTTGQRVGTLPQVEGMRVTSAHKGQYLSVNSQTQQTAYTMLIEELLRQNYADQITTIKLSNPENITLVTAEGITVRLGDTDDLKRKVQAIRTAVSFLRGVDENVGLLDVNDPTDVKYRSDN